MFGAFERTVSMRYLRGRKSEGFVSVTAGFALLGISLGVAALIIVVAVRDGFRDDFVRRVLGFDGHIHLYSYEPLKNYDKLKRKLIHVPGVIGATPLVEGQALIQAKGRAAGMFVRGMRPEDLEKRPLIGGAIRSGDLMSLKRRGTVMIGKRLANKFFLNVGDQLKLIAPEGNSTVFGTVPRAKTFTVGAVFEAGMSQFDSNVIFMSLEEAQVFFRKKQQASAIEVFVKNPDIVAEERERIRAVVGPEIQVYDWKQKNKTFLSALQVERNVMIIIVALIVLIAAFNIVASLTMLVKDKQKDIAIMRSMGATKTMIMRVFFLTGMGIGITGTVIGLTLGLSFCYNIDAIKRGLESLFNSNLFNPEIYYLTNLPAKVEGDSVFLIVFITLLLSFLMTIYPAWRAAKLDPVEGLRNV